MRLPLLGLTVLVFLSFYRCGYKQPELGSIFRFAVSGDIKGFDPAQCDDLYSHIAIKQVYDAPLQYSYLKRPFRLEPALLESLPSLSHDKLEYTFRLKRAVFFQKDPCFAGAKRELTAEDLVYSIKRIADTKVRSPGWWFFEGRIEGLDAFRKKTTLIPKTNYDEKVSGLFVKDRYTLIVRLVQPFAQFPYVWATSYASVVAREAVEYYGLEFLNHPVGTGPYKMVEWRRQMRITYARNPDYRPDFYPSEGEPSDRALGLLEDAGKQLPLTDSLRIHIYKEDEPMWLTYLRQGLDIAIWIPKDVYAGVVTPDLTLRPSYVQKGMELTVSPSLDLVYTCINMEDSLLGKNVHLRRAICLATDRKKSIELFYNGLAIPSHSPIPPGLLGYDSAFKNPYQRYDLEEAKKEMVLAGFPGGKGLPTLHSLEVDKVVYRQMSEKFAKDMMGIGIKMKADVVTWPEFLKRQRTKHFQMVGSAWGADYPDAENFLQLLYGPNASPGSNASCFKNATYDSLYLAMLATDDDSLKVKIMHQMKKIFVEECPWIPGVHRLAVQLRYQWVKNYKFNDIARNECKYIRVDGASRNQRIREGWTSR